MPPNKTSGTTYNETERIIYLDYLRVLSSFAVILIHLAGQNIFVTDVNGSAWQIFNIYESLTRWSIASFVMISGALFLGRDIPLKKIYSKYILKMILIYIVWSVIYAAFADVDLKNRLVRIVEGHYHMWFIPMIAGVYACIPFVRPIAIDKVKTRYFLALSFIFTFALPEITALMRDFGSEQIVKASALINSLAENVNIHMVMGFTAYFVLGYYLHIIEIPKKHRIIIYISGLAGFLLTTCLDRSMAVKTGAHFGYYYSDFNVNILMECIAVFTACKYGKFTSSKPRAFISKAAEYSLGIYLTHALVLDQLYYLAGLSTLSFDPLLSVPCIGVIVFIISFLFSALLHRIPFVKKCLV